MMKFCLAHTQLSLNRKTQTASLGHPSFFTLSLCETHKTWFSGKQNRFDGFFYTISVYDFTFLKEKTFLNILLIFKSLSKINFFKILYEILIFSFFLGPEKYVFWNLKLLKNRFQIWYLSNTCLNLKPSNTVLND